MIVSSPRRPYYPPVASTKTTPEAPQKLEKKQGFWEKHVGKSDDFKAPKESFIDKVHESELREVVVGGAIGTVVGAAAGYAYGMNQLSQNEVSLQPMSETVTNPKLVGADYDHDYWTTEFYPTTDADGNTQTHTRQVYHPDDWDPIVENLDTGARRNYTKLVNSNTIGPIGGAAIGAGIGLVTGVAVGALSRVLTRGSEQVERPSYDSWDRYTRTEPKSDREKMADKAPLIGTAVGAAVGGTAGFLAGSAVEAAGQSLTQTILEPVYENRVIGHIPRTSEFRSIPREYFSTGDKLYYDRLPESYGNDPFNGSERVVRRYFTGQFQPTETTQKSNFFNPVTGMLTGTVLGAGVGLGMGVATGVLMRMTASEEASTPSTKPEIATGGGLVRGLASMFAKSESIEDKPTTEDNAPAAQKDEKPEATPSQVHVVGLDCPGCGAPVAGSGSCGYCGGHNEVVKG